MHSHGICIEIVYCFRAQNNKNATTVRYVANKYALAENRNSICSCYRPIRYPEILSIILQNMLFTNMQSSADNKVLLYICHRKLIMHATYYFHCSMQMKIPKVPLSIFLISKSCSCVEQYCISISLYNYLLREII